MKVLIIEDELFARQRILKLLQEVDWVNEVNESGSGREALEHIKKHEPDLLFLDVNLQDMTGFEVLQQIEVNPKPIVIFVTAHDFHAHKAFDFDAFDFLLKPFKNERFHKTMEKVSKISKAEANDQFDRRVKELIRLHELKNKKENGTQKLPIKIGNKTLLIEVEKINYIEASGYYAEIFVDGRKFLTRESLNNLSEILDENQFLRIHRSHIINLNFVQEIVHSEYSEVDVRMKDQQLFRVSKSQKKEFFEKIGLK